MITMVVIFDGDHRWVEASGPTAVIFGDHRSGDLMLGVTTGPMVVISGWVVVSGPMVVITSITTSMGQMTWKKSDKDVNILRFFRDFGIFLNIFGILKIIFKI